MQFSSSLHRLVLVCCGFLLMVAIPNSVHAVTPSVSAGGHHSLLLKSDGSALASGANDFGQLGDGTATRRTSPVPVMSGVVAISAGYDHSLFLKADGSAWASGHNYNGQIGDGTTTNRLTPVQVLTEVVAISAGANFSLFLRIDGSVWACGRNVSGQLGDGTTTQRDSPVQVLTDVSAIAAGYYHSLFLKEDGSAWACGTNFYGHASGNPKTPVQVLTDVSAIAASYNHSLFLKKDGSVWACGYNDDGQLGDGTNLYRSGVVQVLNGVSAIATGFNTSFFRLQDGSVRACGANEQGQLGDGSIVSRKNPVPVLAEVFSVAAGFQHSLFLRNDGTVWASGSNQYGQLANPAVMSGPTLATPALILSSVVSASAGSTHSLFLKTDGSAWACGDNFLGQLGDGSTSGKLSPIQVATGVSAVFAGSSQSVFLKANGAAWVCGNNTSGRLGTGSTANQTIPVQVLTGVATVAFGTSHTLFLKDDGSVWASGDNTHGQLGNEWMSKQTTPVQVLTGVAAIAAGRDHSLFLMKDGTVFGHGHNSHGQLGNVPFGLPVISGVSAIATSDSHSLFLKADGSVWACGENASGQLGDGTFYPKGTPVSVLNNVSSLSASSEKSAFLKTGGTAWACGLDIYPDSKETTPYQFRNIPVSIVGGITSLSAGYQHNLFRKSDGSVWGTGRNLDGRLGTKANPAAFSFKLAGAFQTITFPVIADRSFRAGATVALTATASSGLPVSYSIVAGPATVTGATFAITGPGQITVRATQVGNSSYQAATPADRTFTVAKAAQTITFAPLADRTVASSAFTLSATASSGLPVAFAVSGVATLSGTTLTLTGATGTVTVTATQTGNDNYLAATAVVRSFEVSTGTAQTITFAALPNRVAGAKFNLSATATSGLPVSFEVVEGDATLAGNAVTIGSTAGTVTIRASQIGGERNGVTYAPAAPVEQSFEVTLGPPTQAQRITFAQPPALTYGDAPYALSATASSELPVVFELVSTVPAGIASLSGSTLTITGAGRVTVRATQPGSFPFKAAAAVNRTITVNKAPLAVSFEPATRLVREANPVFVPNYTGFVNGDDASDLAATRPVGVTSAKPASPAGQYPITFRGGLDANYRFVAGAPSFLTVEGFGGAFETLLFADGVPVGHLTVTVSTNALTYTGVLNLAAEPALLAIRGTLSADDGTLATGAWTRASTASLSALALGFELSDDTLVASVSRNGSAHAAGTGARLFVQELAGKKKLPAPWTGAHTLVLRDPAPLDEADTRVLPLGAGHAAAPVAATGAMTLRGRLADGAALTAAAKPDADGRFRVFARPYAKRTDSALAGRLALVAHPDQARFPGRHYVAENLGELFWTKAALPETTPAKSQDKNYRAGVAASVAAALDPWIPPATKATSMNGVTIPPGTLAQRLGLADSAASTATADLAFLPSEGTDLGAREAFFPATLSLSARGAFSVPPPLPAKADNPAFSLKVATATGAFTGAFTLRDIPEGATKAVIRKVTISGTLRQAPDGSASLGHAHFLLDPSVNDSDTEQVSAELILTARSGLMPALTLPCSARLWRRPASRPMVL